MLNINQKIELKRECINISQAIKSGYNIVEVEPCFMCYNYISNKYYITPKYENITVLLKNIGVLTRVVLVDEAHGNVIYPREAYRFVNFFINMQEYGK